MNTGTIITFNTFANAAIDMDVYSSLNNFKVTNNEGLVTIEVLADDYLGKVTVTPKSIISESTKIDLLNTIQVQNTIGTWGPLTIDATNGKYALNGSKDWMQVNTGTIITFEVPQGSYVSVQEYKAGSFDITVKGTVCTSKALANDYLKAIYVTVPNKVLGEEGTVKFYNALNEEVTPNANGTYKMVLTIGEDRNHIGVTAEATLTVITSVKGVSLNKEETTLAVDGTEKLIATITPEDVTNSELVWSSSNNNVVVVDQNGNITALNPGEAVVKVTTVDGGYTDTCVVTVSKYANTISAGNIDTTYGTPYVVDYDATANKENAVVTYIGVDNEYESTTKPVNAGKYKVVISIEATDEYEAVTKEITLNIDQRTIKLDVQNIETTFGTEKELVYAISEGSLAKGDNANDVFEVAREEGTDVGIYAISVLTLNDNYVVTANRATYTIIAKDATVIWVNADDRTYTGNVFEAPTAYIVDVNGENLPLEVTMTTEGEFKDVNKYDFAVTDVANYNLSNTTKVVEVKKATLTVNWTKQDSYTYGEKFTAPSASVTTLEGEKVPLTPRITSGQDAFLNAGSYDFVVEYNTTNYTIVNATLEDVVIDKAKVNKPVANNNLVYNKGLQAGVTYDENLVKVTEGSVSGTDAKEYTVKFELKDTSNYEWLEDADAVEQVVTYTISKLAVAEPTLVAKEYTYNGKEHEVKLIGVEDYMTINEEESVLKATNAGDYDVVITLDSNHTWAEESDGKVEWSIGKATLDLTDAAWNYDENSNFVYKGNPYTVVIENITLPSDVSINYSGNTQTNASDNYLAVAELVYNSNNYNLVGTLPADLRWKIAQKEVAEPTLVAKEYVYNGKEYEVELIVVEDYMTINEEESVLKATNAGDYDVVITLDSNHTWAEGSDGKVEWSIAKRAITVAVDNQTVTYGDAEATLTYTLTGTLADCHRDADVFAISRVEGTNVGEYAISLEVLNDNYVITYNTGKYVINKKTITGINFEDQAVEYDGKEHSLEISGTLPIGVTVTYTPQNTYTEKGIYVIKATFTDTTGNYIVPINMESTLEIYQGVVSVEITQEESKTFMDVGDSMQLEAIVLPESAKYKEVTWSSSNTSVVTIDQTGLVTAKNSGEAVITATANGVDSTYIIFVRSAIEFTIQVPTITYNENNTTYEITYSLTTPEEYFGDATYEYYDLEGNLISKPIDAGTYKVKVTLEGNEKYKPTSKEKQFIIKKAEFDVSDIDYVKPNDLVYDGNEKAASITGELPEGLECVIKYYSSSDRNPEEEIPTPVTPGTYYFSLVFNSTNPNYKTPDSIGNNYTISKRDLIISWEGEKTVSYNASGTNYALEVTASGLINNTIELVVDGNDEVYRPGTYVYTITGLTNGDSLDNYNFAIDDLSRTLKVLAPSATERVQVVESISNNDKYVVGGVNESKVYALNNTFGSGTVSIENCSEYLINNIVTKEDEQWTISPVEGEEGYYYIHCNGKYISYSSANSTNIVLKTTASIVSKWKLVEHQTYGYCFKSVKLDGNNEVETGRALLFRYSNSYKAFGHYGYTNLNGTEYFPVTLFKLGEEDSMSIEVPSDAKVTISSTSGSIDEVYSVDTITVSVEPEETMMVESIKVLNSLGEEIYLLEIIVNGNTYSGTFNPTENCSILVTYAEKPVAKNISKSVTGEGSIIVTATSLPGLTVSFTLNPNDNAEESKYYYASSYSVKDASNNEIPVLVDGDYYKFTMPNSDVTISATFEQKVLINITQTNATVVVKDSNNNIITDGMFIPKGDITITYEVKIGYESEGLKINNSLYNDETYHVTEDTNISLVATEMPTTSLADAIELCKAVGTTQSTSQIKVRGIVKSINNKQVTITDGKNDFVIYNGVLADGVSQYEVNYIVEAVGYYVNYNGSMPELVAGSTYILVERPEYNITKLVVDGNGAPTDIAEIVINGNKESGFLGETVTFEIVINSNDYIVSSVKVNDVTPSQSGDVYSFTITKDVEIVVTVKIPTEMVTVKVATFEFGENGAASHSDGNTTAITNPYDFAENDQTLRFTSTSKVYKDARDAKGNSCIKLGTGSEGGSFTFTVPSYVNKVTIFVSGYKDKKISVTVNNEVYEINTLSNNGEYTPIEIDTTTNKTVTLATGASSEKRCMINSIELFGEVEKVSATSIELDKKELTLEKGKSETLKATINPENYTDVLSWASNNPSSVTVDNNGKVTAVSTGSATITAKVGELTATCIVTVTVPTLTGITLNKTEEVLNVDDKLTLTASPNPANAELGVLTWTSSNKNVATVSNGIVEAKAAGETTITVTNGTKSATCKITVSSSATESKTITFNLGANGTATHADGSSKTSYSETVDGYTLSLNNVSNFYTGARDAKGNSCIKLGASSKAGGFSLTVPDDVTSVVIYVGKYKSNTSKVTVNGTTYTLSKASDSGQYDVITIDTTTTKTITLTTVSGGYRAMVNTIEFVVGA